jgi:hypothetical protein
MQAIKAILADTNAAEIFSKLQQDFLRIHSLEVRITYDFPTGTKPFLPFDGIWLNKGGQPFLQFYDRGPDTRITLHDGVQLVCRYALFAPHEMSIEGRPIDDLKQLDNVNIYISMDAARERTRDNAAYAKFLNTFRASLSKLTRVRVQVLVNGYSSFEKTLDASNLSLPALPADTENEEWERSILVPVADLFADPVEHYTKQFSIAAKSTVAANIPSPSPTDR